MHPLLLGMGNNPVLLRTRSQVLATRYDVISMQSLNDVGALSFDGAPRVLILCHSLSALQLRQAVNAARLLWPGIKILFVAKPTSTEIGVDADRVVGSLDGPGHLLQAVAELLGHRAVA